jgi:hypothetical protein
MEGINESFATIADRYLHDICVRVNASNAICCRLIGIGRAQTAFHRIYGYDYFHIKCDGKITNNQRKIAFFAE